MVSAEVSYLGNWIWLVLKYGRFSWEVMSQLRMRALASGGRNLISVGTDHKEWITAE